MRTLKLGSGFQEPRRRSLWLEQAEGDLGYGDINPLVGRHHYDVCIIGGGYAGLWTAFQVKQKAPSARVCILEADTCGSGSSGRNAGYAMSYWQKFDSLAKQFGIDAAIRIANQSSDDIAAIEAFATSEGIDIHFETPGWLMAATVPAQLGAWDSFVSMSEKYGNRSYQILDSREVAQRTGSSAYVGAMYDSTVATVQPAHLALALRASVRRLGVELFERSPALSVRNGNEVKTRLGLLVASQAIVFTVGGWTAGLTGKSRTIATAASDICSTAPAAEELDASGWVGHEAITTARQTLRYARRTRDGRLVFGYGASALSLFGRIGTRFDGADGDAGWYQREISRYVPALRGVPVTHTWSGPIDRSVDGLPFFHSPKGRGPRIVVGAGFSGNGLGPSVSAGKILSSLALDLDDEWSRHPFVRENGGTFPVEPFMTVGGCMVRRAVHNVEDAIEAGRRPTPLAGTLARLSPAGLISVKK